MVTLDCDHTAVYRPAPPVPGDMVWCRLCQAYRTVVVTVNELQVRCRNCTYSRKMGVGEETDLTASDADRLAGRHVMRHGHVVEVRDGTDIVKLISNDGQGELPLASLTADRVETSREMQASLRTAFNRSESNAEPRSV